MACAGMPMVLAGAACTSQFSSLPPDPSISHRYGLARGVRGRVVRPIRPLQLGVSQLPGDDGVEECRCHPSTLYPSSFSDQPSPIGQRLPPLPTIPAIEWERLSSVFSGWVSAVRKKRFRPQVSKPWARLKSQVTECQQVSEFQEFQRDLAESGFPYVSCWAFQSGLDHGMPYLAASLFCPAILEDCGQEPLR